MKVILNITEDIKQALLACSEGSDCSECPCKMGEDNCLGTYLDAGTVNELIDNDK